jgi:hypothetical protein
LSREFGTRFSNSFISTVFSSSKPITEIIGFPYATQKPEAFILSSIFLDQSFSLLRTKIGITRFFNSKLGFPRVNTPNSFKTRLVSDLSVQAWLGHFRRTRTIASWMSNGGRSSGRRLCDRMYSSAQPAAHEFVTPMRFLPDLQLIRLPDLAQINGLSSTSSFSKYFKGGRISLQSRQNVYPTR